MKIKKLVLLGKYSVLIVVVIAFILRFWNLGINPPSLYWDEVSQGFNSFSILKTGFDEHHEFLPIARFQAFGDYKAPVYIYLDVLPILLFGQTEFAVRFPSAFFGTLTVLLVYFLSLEIFSEKKHKEAIAFFSSLFLAVSPWHIQLSRVAYEANIATFFTVLGLFLFFVAKRKHNFLFLLSSLSFVIAFYSFNAHRIFIPTLVILLLAVYAKELLKTRQKVIVSGVLSLVLLLPFIFYLRTPESKLRFQEVNIFSDISVVEESNRLNREDGNSYFSKIIHNRRVLYGLSYVSHYFDFFNPSYLFLKGDVNPRFSTQENGELYPYILPFFIVGIYLVTRLDKKNRFFVLGWLLLAPVAAATARETPHALRSETFIPLYEILAGVGVVFLYGKIRKYKKTFIASIAVSVFVFLYYLFDFLHAYYVHMPYNYSQDWQYGYKQAVLKVESLKDNYDEIIFSPILGRAYIYVLWYGKYSPEMFWNEGKVVRDAFGFYNVEGFGKYRFIPPLNYKSMPGRKVLFVGGVGEIPAGSNIIESINYLDGSTSFVVADNSK